ncbi:MAG: Lrp/AsnC ligand binding domain-containing protein [Candidatus Bathyarchaeia archaeon]
MVNACILVKTVPTRIEKVLKDVKRLKGSIKAYVVFGRWDIASFFEVADYHEIRSITSTINSIDGVRSTETLLES